MNISMIGLGKLGLQVAEFFAKKHNVNGYDILQKESDTIRICSTIENCIENSKIIFLALPTPHEELYDGSYPTSDLEPKNFSTKIVETVLNKLYSIVERDQIVVLISTVLPGTIRKMFLPLIGDYKFVYNPFFVAMESVDHDMQFPEMIMLGCDDYTVMNFMRSFYIELQEGTNRIRIETGTWEECESVKVFYNTFISMKLAFVNMIQDVAQKMGNMNVDNITDILKKSTKRIISESYMHAGLGDGGACHPRDNIALSWLSKELDLGYDFFGSITKTREEQARNLAKFVSKFVKEDKSIVIVGKTFKKDSPILQGSYSVLIGHYLMVDMGIKSVYYDPIIGEIPDEIFFNEPNTFLICHNYKIDYPIGSSIIDPWRNHPLVSGSDVIYYGGKNEKSINV